jgi:carboxymethylenebutenolidase
MDSKIKDLYSEYKEGRTDRRAFISKLAMIAGSTAAALALLPIIEDNSLKGSYLPQDYPYPDLITNMVKYPAETGTMNAYMAWPDSVKGARFPAVIIIHENKGLVPHIKAVTERMAREGFVAMAPDALTPVGGTPEDISNVGELFKQLVPEQTTKNFVAAVKYLKTNPLTTGKVGCTGFCWGGAMTNQVAVNSPDLDAAVPYYGMQPTEEQVAQIKAPIMAHYAGDDARINAGIPAFEESLKKYNKEYQIFIYDGAQHAFNNDSNKERYNEQAAKLAWGRTIAFFKEKLK